MKKQSFTNLDVWLKEVEKHGKTDVEIVVIGNKQDLIIEQQQEPEVSQQEIDDFSARTGIKVFLASAKTGLNVDSTFLKLTETLIGKTKPNIQGANMYAHPSEVDKQSTRLFQVKEKGYSYSACCGM
jgi:GTPase SAR1 family protein